MAELVDGDFWLAEPVRLVGEVGQNSSAVVAVASCVRGLQRGLPEFPSRPVLALVEAVPAAGGGERSRQQVEPAAGGFAVGAALEQVGDGAQVGIDQADGVLALFGGQNRQPLAGVLQPVHEVVVHPLAAQGGGETFGFDRGPLGGQAGQRDRAEGHEATAVHGGSLCVSECWKDEGSPQQQRFVSPGQPVGPPVRLHVRYRDVEGFGDEELGVDVGRLAPVLPPADGRLVGTGQEPVTPGGLVQLCDQPRSSRA
ncbi:hypothetical protein ACIRYZ_21760 [Kitasatospora sp. NPDC101155]|uniref:hypothetical protein n=1 Tax=Kitasatospora sp. NPDC101155 TaxID=3364097 RepID=UPI0038219589